MSNQTNKPVEAPDGAKPNAPMLSAQTAPHVFWPAALIVVAFVAIAAIFPSQLKELLGKANTTLINGLGWYYVLIVAGFVVFSLYVGFSRYARSYWARTRTNPSTRCSAGSRCCSQPVWASVWCSGVWPSH